MRTVVAVLGLIACVSAFDCFGRNSSCSESHVTCDTGYDPYCEHIPGPGGEFFGICTCDKVCSSASDCTDTQADGCPPNSFTRCDTNFGVCVCAPAPPPRNNNVFK